MLKLLQISVQKTESLPLLLFLPNSVFLSI